MTISNNFTIEEIHKIRYENYEATKKLSPSELIENTKNNADVFKSKLRKYNKAKHNKS